MHTNHSSYVMPYTHADFWPNIIESRALEEDEVAFKGHYELWDVSLNKHFGLPSHLHKHGVMLIVISGSITIFLHGDKEGSTSEIDLITGQTQHVDCLQKMAIVASKASRFVLIKHIGEDDRDRTTFWAKEEEK